MKPEFSLLVPTSEASYVKMLILNIDMFDFLFWKGAAGEQGESGPPGPRGPPVCIFFT